MKHPGGIPGRVFALILFLLLLAGTAALHLRRQAAGEWIREEMMQQAASVLLFGPESARPADPYFSLPWTLWQDPRSPVLLNGTWS